MKVVAAYLLAVLGGNNTPTADNLKSILGSVGAEADDERIELLLSQVKGKDITELIAAGMEKLASVPSGGGGVAVAASAAPAAGGAAAPAAEAKKEEKVEEKEESDDKQQRRREEMMTSLASSSTTWSTITPRWPWISPNSQLCHSAPTLNSPFIKTPLLFPRFHLSLTLPPHRTSHFAISSMAEADTTSTTKPFSVLFVCLGNICRSPAAEGVFRDIVVKKGLDSKFNIDSAGTINYHEGNPADPRMRATSKKRGIEITSISRPIRASDFKDFDIILAMDRQNREDILGALERWKFREPLPEDAHNKVKLMCSYCKKHEESEVPDPYYGGQQGFEKVLDLLEDACESLLDSILAENSHIGSS
ncbi:Putative low molecular weight protein-tyrosine-phosphatase slr0328 [Linum grandiflorum]